MRARLATIGVILLATLLGCRAGGDAPPEVGGIYSVVGDSVGFGVVKVLALDPGVVHVRLYANQYAERPGQVDPSSLRLGRIGDPGGFGIGHLPLSAHHFAAWQPQLVSRTPVSDDELEGYREWKASGGGVWDR